MDITKDQIIAAQEQWGAGIFKIGKAFIDKLDYEAVAREHIATLYAYEQSPVLFKPTKAAQQQFRGTADEALSYFVATNGTCPEDKGFAIQPWTAVRFENTGFVTSGNTALAMGNYFFTDLNGDETKVEYSFGYMRDTDGQLRINLHHSSVPFSA
ncbi:MAG: hypothetical protein AAF203_10720 [Pseudomonadota bacterium]